MATTPANPDGSKSICFLPATSTEKTSRIGRGFGHGYFSRRHSKNSLTTTRGPLY